MCRHLRSKDRFGERNAEAQLFQMQQGILTKHPPNCHSSNRQLHSDTYLTVKQI